MTKLICLDAGHGGNDTGAIGNNNAYEKNITLNLSRILGDILSSQSGIKVLLTRTNDYYTSLQDRVFTANANNADYFISLHCNSHKTTEPKGIETYCYRFGGEGEKLANSIQNQLIEDTERVDRKTKEANFQVLRDTKMPAVLIELCFLSNSEEEQLLNDADFLLKSAEAIAKGICNYLGIDFDNILAEVKDATKWVKDNNISDGTRPNNNITREEAWVMLYRTFNK